MKRWRDLASTICGLIAAVFLAAMMLLTVADVVLRAVLNTPIRGIYDLVELLLAYTCTCPAGHTVSGINAV